MVVTRSTTRRQQERQARVHHHPGYHYVGQSAAPSDPEARDASQFLKQLWQLPPRTQHLPVPNPVSLLRQDMGRLREQDYFASAKLDGVRFLLLLAPRAPAVKRTWTQHAQSAGWPSSGISKRRL